MNTSVQIDFLLNSAANKATSSAKPANSAEKGLEFKEQFEKQLQPSSKQANNLVNSPPSRTEENQDKAKLSEKNVHAVDRNRRADPNNAADSNQQQVVAGESLPITEEARKFLAALPEEDQQQLLEEVRQWLANLSPEDLQKLQQQLAENPEELAALLPRELQELLAKLEGVKLDELLAPEGFTALLASLLNADIDFQRVAAIQVQPALTSELRLVADVASVSSEPKPLSSREASVNRTTPLSLTDSKAETNQQPKEQANSRQDKLNELVSNLGKASIASANGSARTGGEALNQLLQAAGMGLSGVQAAGAATQTMGRVAAGLSAMPFMMQAAANSNAQALASRISMMNAKNMQVAEMRLDPPNLGSVRIQIRIQGEQASVVFQAPNAHARELLEQSLPKLREMMEAEGMVLADAQVSEESFSGQGDEKGNANQYAGSGLSGDEETTDEQQIPLLTQPLGLIDYYA